MSTTFVEEAMRLAVFRGDSRELRAHLEAREALVKQMAEALSAMLTHMGMDEDDWNKPAFEQARAALSAYRENQP